MPLYARNSLSEAISLKYQFCFPEWLVIAYNIPLRHSIAMRAYTVLHFCARSLFFHELDIYVVEPSLSLSSKTHKLLRELPFNP